jgi:hypothetical protein
MFLPGLGNVVVALTISVQGHEFSGVDLGRDVGRRRGESYRFFAAILGRRIDR